MPTEAQTNYNISTPISAGISNYKKGGQRLFIPGREVTKLGFWLTKAGSPTGAVTFEIRKVSDDSLINSKVWGDASLLPTSVTYEEVTFDVPSLITEEVRICVSYLAGGSGNVVQLYWQTSDVKASEFYTLWDNSWTDLTSYDCAYVYTYEGPSGSKGLSVPDMATMMQRL